MLPQMDYNEEARKLWSRLSELQNDFRSFHNNLDPMHQAENGGIIYVGSDTAARCLDTLKSRNITGVVNCASNIPCHHIGHLDYYKFDIADWRRHTQLSGVELKHFLSPVFEFINVKLEKGESVLVHCLAGAHRAGTTGIMCLMHYEGMDSKTAILEAKKRRPIIDPIGDFKSLLGQCDMLPREMGQQRFKLY
eukprot:TRINITY_DN11176_c0_g1_i1.p1 TRINITY_DN11176_c0_g1~~TRINITY_DN11176_c0_g1_i1.p1  ORF type:complete len:193 (-),score=31.66 TRINITY_DN11176_c0_g1_i1:214-792(-)